jgi:hypothetical protein
MAIGEELDYDHTVHTRQRGGDDKLAIRFFKKARPNPEKTQKEGRPIFEEVDFIQIMVPGDRTSVIVRPVGPGDEERFRRQYDHWKTTQSNDLTIGTPLEAWGVLNMAQIEEFRYFGIRTVEHMADLRDDIVAKIMGATILKQKARIFVDAAKAEAPLKAVTAALEERDSQIAALQQSVAEQANLIKELREKLPD